MWERFGMRSTKRSEGKKAPFGALDKVRGRLERQGIKCAQTMYSRAIGLGVGALAGVATILLLLVLRRRATRNGNSSEGENEEPTTGQAEGHSDREVGGAESTREYFKKLMEDTKRRSGLGKQ
jgi:hypothetical protein